jgi:hypothetical protein
MCASLSCVKPRKVLTETEILPWSEATSVLASVGAATADDINAITMIIANLANSPHELVATAGSPYLLMWFSCSIDSSTGSGFCGQ